jgi:hypothetical protein
LAQAFAAAWQQKLANEGQLLAILQWWTGRAGAMPPITTIQKVMGQAFAVQFKLALKAAFTSSIKNSKDWDAAAQRARKYAVDEANSWATS